MTELGIYACRTCGAPLLYGLQGLSCPRGRTARAPVPGKLVRLGVDCTGETPDPPVKTRPKTVEKFVCSCGCRRAVKLKPGETLDGLGERRECERGGLLVFDRIQSR